MELEGHRMIVNVFSKLFLCCFHLVLLVNLDLQAAFGRLAIDFWKGPTT